MLGTTTPSERVTRRTTPKSPATIVSDGCVCSVIATWHSTDRTQRLLFHLTVTLSSLTYTPRSRIARTILTV